MRIVAIAIALSLAACSAVDVTKTAKGSYDPTDPNEIEILKTVPVNKEYFELGVVTATGFSANAVAEMHNAVRAKASALGANAVVLTEEGILKDGWARERWATGTAIRWGKAEY